MIQKEMHAAYMEFVMCALQTHTVKVLVAKLTIHMVEMQKQILKLEKELAKNN